MKVQKNAAIIVLTLTAFSSIGGGLPSQANTNIRYTPESFNTLISFQKKSANAFGISGSSDLLVPMMTSDNGFHISLEQNLKRKPPLARAAMDNILQLTTEQVIRKNSLLDKLAYDLELINKDLENGLRDAKNRDLARAIAKEKKTTLNKNFFAELRRMLTPNQLKNKKGLDYLAKYEEFWVNAFS